MWQNQREFYLNHVPCNIFEGSTYKYILTGVDVVQRYKITRALTPWKQVWLHLCWKQHIKSTTCLNTQRYFNKIMGLILKVMWLLAKHNINIRRQQKNSTKFIYLLWKLLTKIWQNSCLSLWILNSRKTLKYDGQFWLKTWTAL